MDGMLCHNVNIARAFMNHELGLGHVGIVVSVR